MRRGAQGGYQVVAGERRLRAAGLAGLKQIAVEAAQEELLRQQSLCEKGFVSKSAVEPYQRRAETAHIALEEMKLTIRNNFV